MTLIEGVRTFIQSFPQLRDKRIDIDCLSSKADFYSVDSVMTEPIIKRYLDGSSVRQFTFLLSSRMYYGANISAQNANIAFFDSFSEWLDKQNALGNFPNLGEKRKVRSIEVSSSAYPFIVDSDTGLARYQIQCKMIYFQEV